MPDQPINREADDDPVDPNLDAVAAAIVDGDSVDLSGGTWGSISEFASELEIVAKIADLHRSIPSDPPSARSRFPPEFPWRVGTLRITQCVGRGAFGEVFRAWDEQLHRDVAVKLLFQGRRQGEVSPSLDEGRLLAKIRHPNVVTVYGAERIDDRLALITEFVDGRSLAEIIREDGRLHIADVAHIAIDLCRALSAVHRAGLLHRDIKAQNVVRETSGRIVLMDFGAGRFGLDGAAAGARRTAVGTPLYVAPEIWLGAPATIRSDIYSLAVLLFYLATGTFPVQGNSVEEIREAHANDRRKRLRDERPEVPQAFADAIERALAANPADRYESAAALETAIARGIEELVPRSGSPVVAWTAAAVALLVLAGLAHRGSLRIPAVASRSPNNFPSASVVAGDTVSSVVKKLELPDFSIVGRPSRDGRFVPFSDTDGNLCIWEVATGSTQQVTSKRHPDEWTWGSLMSPDGTRIAYTWGRADKIVELRIADTASHEYATLLTVAATRAEEPQLLDWSQNGRDILLLVPHVDGTSELTLLPTAGGDPVPLQAFRSGTPRHASISPDGRFIAFDLPANDGNAQRDILIMDSGGSTPRILLGGQSNDLLPTWTPDGQRLFFASDRSGLMSGWLLPVTNGKSSGEPVMVARALGRISPLGLTNGGYFYILRNAMAEVYTVGVDMTGNSPPGTPARVSTSRAGGHMGPDWSPDGRQLAYIALSGEIQDQDSNAVMIQDAELGATRRLSIPRLSYVGVVKPRWAPGGRRLLVRGRDVDNRDGLHVIDAMNGTVLDYVDSGQTNCYHWSPDGTSILYLRNLSAIVSHELGSAVETVVFDGPTHGLKRVLAFGPSPEGGALAISGVTAQGIALMTWSPVTGLRELYRPGGLIIFQAWTPDATQILVTRAGPNQPHRLMRIPAAGGAAVDMDVPIEGFTQVNFVAISPNGQQVAYTTGGPGVDVMLMERFLPR